MTSPSKPMRDMHAAQNTPTHVDGHLGDVEAMREKPEVNTFSGKINYE
jgi:hypothetical protein